MIEITHTHIYKLTSTPGVTQNMPSTHQKINTPKFLRDFSSSIPTKGEKGHWKKSICSRSIEKKEVLQSKRKK
jgi:hypothetical protein